MYCTCIGLSRAASDVKEAIDRFNSGLKGVGPLKRKAAARAEAASLLLHKKSKQQQPGTHKFVCLAQSNKYFIPSSDYDKDKLFMADLGEKVIGFTKLDMDNDEFCGVLYMYDSYPKLRDAGGYVMCRAKKIAMNWKNYPKWFMSRL